METNRIVTGDAFDVLADLPDASVHAVVTDPPYGLAFMGRDWDDFDPKEYQEWCEAWATEAKRVLKPGGHLLAFSGNRTHHRLFSGVEDAGFEIRDTLTWHYGSGFPKALDVSKAIDKAEGAEREVVGTRRQRANSDASNVDLNNSSEPVEHITTPATDAAEEWQGWKTALKPATEFVVVARAPLSEGTVAANVQAHGTGALNVDGCRVEISEPEEMQGEWDAVSNGGTRDKYGDFADDDGGNYGEGKHDAGRYPANVVFDEQAAADLDERVDVQDASTEAYRGASAFWGEDGKEKENIAYSDSGGPSRYFYTSKASRAERTEDGRIDNAHPTVKPQDLMEWLVRLVTREGQIVLDPFAGSGTTCKAAKALGREFVGIEQQAQWADVARVRCGLAAEDPAHVRDDPAQTGVADF